MNCIGSPRFCGGFLGTFRHSYLECRAACDPDKDQANWVLLLQVLGVCVCGGTLGLASELGGSGVLALFVWEAHRAGSGGGQALGRVLWEPQQPPASGGGKNVRSQTVAPGCWSVIKSGVQTFQATRVEGWGPVPHGGL